MREHAVGDLVAGGLVGKDEILVGNRLTVFQANDRAGLAVGVVDIDGVLPAFEPLNGQAGVQAHR